MQLLDACNKLFPYIHLFHDWTSSNEITGSMQTIYYFQTLFIPCLNLSHAQNKFSVITQCVLSCTNYYWLSTLISKATLLSSFWTSCIKSAEGIVGYMHHSDDCKVAGHRGKFTCLSTEPNCNIICFKYVLVMNYY